MRRAASLLCLGVLLAVVVVPLALARDRASSPPVMGWVPAYSVDASMIALKSHPDIGNTLTAIGLQFWNPCADGSSVVLAPVDKTGRAVTPADIARVRDWAHAHGIKVLLTVYNNSETTHVWNWKWALRGFRDHRASFIKALMAQMDKYHLDGIDVDLEGNGMLDADRATYAAFVKALSVAVHTQGKLLTIDTFHSPCYNAPNMSWWKDWHGHVDALHIMGYQDLYEASTATFQPTGQPVCENGAHIFKYSWQLAYGLRAGYRADQIVMGLPTWLNQWGKKGAETSAASHVREVQALGVGVGLWDLTLPKPAWRSDATWKALHALRTHPGDGWKTLKASKTAGRPKAQRVGRVEPKA